MIWSLKIKRKIAYLGIGDKIFLEIADIFSYLSQFSKSLFRDCYQLACCVLNFKHGLKSLHFQREF